MSTLSKKGILIDYKCFLGEGVEGGGGGLGVGTQLRVDAYSKVD